jgi:hypothetical protein
MRKDHCIISRITNERGVGGRGTTGLHSFLLQDLSLYIYTFILFEHDD